MDYELIRSERKTVALRVRPDGTVEVRAPKRLDRRTIDDFVRSHAAWIEKKRRQAEKTAPGPAERLSEAELRALTEQAWADLNARVQRLGPLVGVSWGKVTVRHQRSRWGSCTLKGDLSLNCLLLLCPPEVRDYVVLHELCHRRQMNHSRAFWAEVERVMPDWQEKRRWLRQNGPAILRRMTG